MLVVAVPGVARAKPKGKIEILSVDWPKPGTASPDRQKRVKRAVRSMAAQAAKHLDFGAARKAEITFSLRELSVSEEDGLVRVSCTLHGRLRHGGGARSKIAFGGKPDRKKQIERQVLSSVTDSVMVRLAELARAA